MKSLLKRGFILILCLVLNMLLKYQNIVLFVNIGLSIINFVLFIIKDVQDKKFIKSSVYAVGCIVAFILAYVVKITQIIGVMAFINVFIFVFELADYMKLKNPKTIEIVFFGIICAIVICTNTTIAEIRENRAIKEEKQLLSELEIVDGSNLYKKDLMEKIEEITGMTVKDIRVQLKFIKAGELVEKDYDEKTTPEKVTKNLNDLVMDLENSNVNMSEASKEIKSNISLLKGSIEIHESEVFNTLIFALFEVLEIVVLFLKSDELRLSSKAII